MQKRQSSGTRQWECPLRSSRNNVYLVLFIRRQTFPGTFGKVFHNTSGVAASRAGFRAVASGGRGRAGTIRAKTVGESSRARSRLETVAYCT
ncbi:hypothetical protein NDU88_004179 [Pleurodeles waltl]|uniref:Uncharacterized protein n=1 Tax=Pleurodeles waltl TaxID=8319 RepID=A0AAV7WVT6_PLEWA|nr:hypothetical protein NDU88_004179 [Pleurodeles waltl]